jgi:ferredoxin/flavodoxin---NADP+ reductase
MTTTIADDRFYRATVTGRTDLSHDLWTMRIRPEGEFKFSPGQYATLCLTGAARRLERPYSIVSAPHEDELEFFFELVPGGDLTPELHQLQVGDALHMRKTQKGRFTLDIAAGTNHFMVCTVTGVAPFVSFIRTLYRDWNEAKFQGDHQFFLLNGASRSWEFGYVKELQKIAAEVTWLKYVPTVSRPWEDAKWPGEVGRVDELIRKYTDKWELNAANTVAYLCGHPGMVEQGKGILQRRGFRKESIKEEVYWVPAKHAAAS